MVVDNGSEDDSFASELCSCGIPVWGAPATDEDSDVPEDPKECFDAVGTERGADDDIADVVVVVVVVVDDDGTPVGPFLIFSIASALAHSLFIGNWTGGAGVVSGELTTPPFLAFFFFL